MKVTYIHQYLSFSDGYGGSRPWQFARRLARDSIDVTVICQGPQKTTFTKEGVRIIQVPAHFQNTLGSLDRIKAFLQFMIGATWIACRLKADVIFASSTPLTVAVPGIISSILRRAPLVFEVRDLWPSVPARLGYLKSTWQVRLAQVLERMAYRRASIVIALSPGMREGILQTEPKADVRLIPNACDFEEFRFSHEEKQQIKSDLEWDNKPTVVYAGSFGESYRIQWLVHLASEMPDVRFQFIGRGSSFDECRSLSTKLQLPTGTLLPGRMARTDVARRLAVADIAISSLSTTPSLANNSLNKVFDAMAAGKPVIFNHDGWLSELLCGNDAGWRLSDDPAVAAIELRKLLADINAVKEAGRASAELGHQFFGREDLYGRFKEAIEHASKGIHFYESESLDFEH